MLTIVPGSVEILFKTLANSHKTAEQINKAFATKGLPPAFTIDESGKPVIPGNPDYRFEGFGVIVLPPQLSFWVHYKPESPQHVSLGKFTVPIGVSKLLDLQRLLGS